jgi:hypothetical protein
MNFSNVLFSCLGDWYQREGEECGEKVWEDEYGADVRYTSMYKEKWDLLKLFQEWR